MAQNIYAPDGIQVYHRLNTRTGRIFYNSPIRDANILVSGDEVFLSGSLVSELLHIPEYQLTFRAKWVRGLKNFYAWTDVKENLADHPLLAELRKLVQFHSNR